MTKRSQWLRLQGELDMNISRLLGLIVIISSLSSCIPYPHGAYYKPSYPDNNATLKNSGGICRLGPFSKLELPIPDGVVQLGIHEDEQDQFILSMRLGLSGNSTLQFTSNVIRLSDQDKGTEWKIEANVLKLDYLSGKIPYAEAVDFSKGVPAAPEYILNDIEVWIPFSIADFSPDAIRLHLPPIVVGSEEYKIPPIFLEADKEKYKLKKWDWWPYKWEKEKVDRFTIYGAIIGGYNGSSGIDSRLRVPELSGNVMIDFPALTKWQFATNELRFEDVYSGNVRQFHFKHLLVESDMRVSFTAPFCCSMHAVVRVPIGEARPEKLRVDIPPFLINGKEFIIKPIIFDLKKFTFVLSSISC